MREKVCIDLTEIKKSEEIANGKIAKYRYIDKTVCTKTIVLEIKKWTARKGGELTFRLVNIPLVTRILGSTAIG